MVFINRIAIASMLAVLVAAAPLEKRSGATVAADLKDVGMKLDTLVAEVDKYQGGIVAGLPIQQAATPLETAINKAATDIKAEPASVDEAAARQVLQAFTEIEPSIKKTTDSIASKSAVWGSLKGTVKGDMLRIKTASDSVSDSLVAKAPAALQQQATEAKAKVDGYFDNAIKSVS